MVRGDVLVPEVLGAMDRSASLLRVVVAGIVLCGCECGGSVGKPVDDVAVVYAMGSLGGVFGGTIPDHAG